MCSFRKTLDLLSGNESSNSSCAVHASCSSNVSESTLLVSSHWEADSWLGVVESGLGVVICRVFIDAVAELSGWVVCLLLNSGLAMEPSLT